MSKKAQPHKGDSKKHKIQALDEQNEPYLRALQKKIRNQNKKLVEIADLESKDNLKPEQIQKIKRKAAIQEQISKIQENATFFREVYVQNAAQYRNNQLKELDGLAKALALFHCGSALQDHGKLTSLWKVIEHSDKRYETLNQSVEAIGSALKEFANDRKLQKAVNDFVEQNGNSSIKAPEVKQEKVVNEPVNNVVPEVKVKVEEAPKVQTPVAVAVSEPKVAEVKPEPVVEKVQQKPAVIVEAEPTPIAQEPIEVPKKEGKQGERAEERKEGEGRGRGRQNRERPYKGKGGYKGRDRPEGDGVRKQYKPKYEEKGEVEQKRRSASSDSSSSEEVQQFKKDEIAKLQDDGFTVVGKPKPKPKDPKEMRNFHDHQHGKKNHHHGKATNY